MGLCTCIAFIFLSSLGVWSMHTGCTLQSPTHESYYVEGEIILGGIFVVHSGYTAYELTLQEEPKPISCEGFNIRFYRDVLAMVFAVKEINTDPEILGAFFVTFRIFDSCASESRAIERLFELLSGNKGTVPGYRCQKFPPLAGIIGESISSLTVPMARILGVFHYPQISHVAPLPSLSDKIQFPSFLRRVRSTTFQNRALAGLIGHFHWTWVGLVVSNDDLGIEGGQTIKASIEDSGGCVAFVEQIDLRYPKEKVLQVAKGIKRHSVKVILVHSTAVHVKKLLEVLWEQNVTNRNWIFTIPFVMTTELLRNGAWGILNGSLGIAPYTDRIPGFEEFLRSLHPSRYPEDIFIKLFWEKVFDCKFQNLNVTPDAERELGKELVPCSADSRLDNLTSSVFELNDLTYSYQSYTAVYALAHAANKLALCKPGKGPFGNGSCADVKNIQPWQTLHYLKNLHYKTRTGFEIFFDENGDGPSAYDILNVQISENEEFRLIKVGRLDPAAEIDKQIIIDTDAILWSDGSYEVPRSVCSENCPPGFRQSPREGEPVCCFACVPCPQGEISNDTDKCIRCPESQWPSEQHDVCVQKVTEFLTFDEPLGLTVTISAIILILLTASVLFVFINHRNTPIVKANNRAVSYLLLLNLILCFLCAFIFIGRPEQLTCMLRQTVFGIIFTVIVSSVLAKTVIVVLAFKATNPNNPARRWLGSKTPFCIISICSVVQMFICIAWIESSPPFPEQNMKAFNEKIIFECNEGDATFFYCMLGYIGLLATVSFVVAFLARNLPDSFNEAKLITFSMLVFVTVWVSFIPAYLSTQGKYMVAVELFAILSSSASLLGCIFFPKCYIILVRTDKNTRKNVLGKHVHIKK